MGESKRNITWRRNVTDPYAALAAGVLDDAWRDLEKRLEAAHDTRFYNERDHHLRRAVIAYQFLTTDTCNPLLLNLDPERVRSRIRRTIGRLQYEVLEVMAHDQALIRNIISEIENETDNKRRLSRRAAAKRK